MKKKILQFVQENQDMYNINDTLNSLSNHRKLAKEISEMLDTGELIANEDYTLRTKAHAMYQDNRPKKEIYEC